MNWLALFGGLCFGVSVLTGILLWCCLFVGSAYDDARDACWRGDDN